MGNDATKVSAGKPVVTGAISFAPVGTTLPTDASTALDAAFKQIGYASDDGVTNSLNKEVTKIKAWGGDTVLVLNNSMDDQFKFKMLQTIDEAALKAVYGEDNVTITPAAGGQPEQIAINVNNAQQSPKSWVIDMILNGGALKRIVIPTATIESVGDIVYKDDEAIGYDVTLAAGADTAGNTHYEYITGAAE